MNNFKEVSAQCTFVRTPNKSFACLPNGYSGSFIATSGLYFATLNHR